MKEMWEKPRILVEEFAPNDYVAVCYELDCSTGNNNRYMPTKDSGQTYTSAELWGEYGESNRVTVNGEEYSLDGSHYGACTDPDKNAIRVDGNGDVHIWESSNWGEELPSVVTKKYDTTGDGAYGAGDLFAWVTFSSRWNMFWRHWAIAGVLTKENPNRS